MKRTILIVDDTEINRTLLSDMLSPHYNIVEAKNGREAVTILEKNTRDIALILLDIVMPEMDGFEVLSYMNSRDYIKEIPVIVISAESGSDFINYAYELGAMEYIARPFNEKAIFQRVKNIIMLFTKQKILEETVMEQMQEKEKTNELMVEILSHIVEFRNNESGLHVKNIRVITEIILKHLVKISTRYNLTSADIRMISNASALHDIGKISISEEILNKPGKLIDEEYEIMKNHSIFGAEILESVSGFQNEKFLKEARDVCRWHHERYDGKGYPDGLVGEEIPISAQVVSLADVYDALTSARVYKSAYSHEKAVKMIRNGECGTFNPLLLQCLMETQYEIKRELKYQSFSGISKNIQVPYQKERGKTK